MRILTATLGCLLLLFGVFGGIAAAYPDVYFDQDHAKIIIDARGDNHDHTVTFFRPTSVSWDVYYRFTAVDYSWDKSDAIAIVSAPAGKVSEYDGKKVIRAITKSVEGGVVAVVNNKVYDGAGSDEEYWVGYWHYW